MVAAGKDARGDAPEQQKSASDSQQQQPPPQQQQVPRRRLLKWADEDGTGAAVAEDVPTLDMFGGEDTERTAAPKAVPFHQRQAAERAAFAAVQEQARAKRARLETVRAIHSRQEMQAAEAAALAEEQRQNQAKADAEANAAIAAEASGPKKWGLKRSREGEDEALSYGGATIPIAKSNVGQR